MTVDNNLKNFLTYTQQKKSISIQRATKVQPIVIFSSSINLSPHQTTKRMKISEVDISKTHNAFHSRSNRSRSDTTTSNRNNNNNYDNNGSKSNQNGNAKDFSGNPWDDENGT